MSSNGSASSSSSAESENSLVLAAVRRVRFNFDWRWTPERPIDIPLRSSLEVPETTLQLVVTSTSNSCTVRYKCLVKDGRAVPMHEMTISVNNHYPNPAAIIHESGLQNSGGVCSVPGKYLQPGMYITLIFTLNFYCKWNWSNMSFLNLLKLGHHSDVKITSKDGQEFNAHGLILRAKNKTFREILGKEKDETLRGIIEFNDISTRAVKFLLHFIYSSQILKISADENETGEDVTLEEVLQLGKKFGLDELTSSLEEKMGEFCTKDNSWRLFKLCKHHCLENGRKAVLKFMLENNADFIDKILSQAA